MIVGMYMLASLNAALNVGKGAEEVFINTILNCQHPVALTMWPMLVVVVTVF